MSKRWAEIQAPCDFCGEHDTMIFTEESEEMLKLGHANEDDLLRCTHCGARGTWVYTGPWMLSDSSQEYCLWTKNNKSWS